MDFSKIAGLLGQFAPTLATAVGGPLAGLAAKTVSNVLLGRPDGSPQELEAAISNATPEQLAALKKVDADFRVRMRELDIDLERVQAGDRANARQRELTARDWTPKVLAFFIVGGFFGCLVWMLIKGMPTSGTEAILMMLGALTNTVTAVVAYYFGSSAGSREKDKALTTSNGVK
jgi:hypothetical protein